jgi:predicted ATPase/class 3 adenylate cyclase
MQDCVGSIAEGVRVVGRPTGTVTFLFTDIEGSTRLWDDHPDNMALALARHDDLLRSAIDEHDGFVFSTGGDGVAAAFHRAGDAVSAAVAAQRALQSESWPAPAELRVRMGLHTGETEERDGDYFGPPVNRAARVMGAAAGQQIVMSAVTAGLLDRNSGVDLVDLGAHQLKGLVEPIQVFGVRAPDMVWVDRPLTTAEHRSSGNLLTPVTEWIGPVTRLRQRASELPRRRLVTITGTGGVGKTRAATEVGWMMTDEFAGGVWFVELAPVGDPDVVVAAVAATLGVPAQEAMTPVEAVVDWLRGRRVLLILDNCEHVMAPITELVRAIVAGCPTVTVLATSREPLGVPGEQVLPMPSLATPHAVELFCTRARSGDDSIEFDERDMQAIATICERLDGIPLAIEMAAARVRMLSPTDLLTRLEDRFRVLRGSGRGLERHQTLRAMVAWSYQLLTDQERHLFDRLSVFAGGFDLAAAEAICTDDVVDEFDLLDLLAGLVDKSMVIADRADGVVRYRLLETLRQYGEERLDDHGDTAPLRDRHLNYYLSHVKHAAALVFSPRQMEGDAIFEREWDNARAAQSWAVTNGDAQSAAGLVIACWDFARHRSRFEHAEWAERTIALDPADGTFGRVYGLAAAWAAFVGEFTRALELTNAGISSAPFPEHPSTGQCWINAVSPLMTLGRLDEARECWQKADTAATASGDQPLQVLVASLAVRMATHEPSLARSAIKRYDDVARTVGSPSLLAIAAYNQGSMHHWLNDPPDHGAAAEAYRRAHSMATAAKSTFDEIFCSTGLLSALLAGEAGPDAACTRLFRRACDSRLWLFTSLMLEVLASNMLRNGDPEGGAVIAGYFASREEWHQLPVTFTGGQASLELARRHPQCNEWMPRGAAMNRDLVAAFALDRLQNSPEA